MKQRLSFYEANVIEKLRFTNPSLYKSAHETFLSEDIFGHQVVDLESASDSDFDVLIESLQKLKLQAAQQEHYEDALFFRQQINIVNVYRQHVNKKKVFEINRKLQQAEELKVQASKHENYLDAAKYRDQIKELEGERQLTENKLNKISSILSEKSANSIEDNMNSIEIKLQDHLDPNDTSLGKKSWRNAHTFLNHQRQIPLPAVPQQPQTIASASSIVSSPPPTITMNPPPEEQPPNTTMSNQQH